jgi:ADP-ribose pyrophosphatase
LLLDSGDQSEVATASALDNAARGIPDDCADIGVVYQDRFLVVVRDAVRFRSGATGPYVRTFNATGARGCAVLPVMPDGSVVLVSHFRHATRRWHWEIPRGFGDGGEDPASTATRELHEELQLDVLSLEYLGELAMGGAEPDVVMLAHVKGVPQADREEGIDDVAILPLAELDEWIAHRKLADPYTFAAVGLARAGGLLGPSIR